MKKRVYKKFMNRSIPLLYCELLYEGETVGFKKICGDYFFFDPLCVYKKGKGTDVYYDYEDLAGDPNRLADFFKKNKKKFFSLAGRYARDCEKLKELLKGGENKNFKKIFRLNIKTRPFRVATSIFAGYMSTKVDKEILKESLRLRNKYDKLSYLVGEKLVDIALGSLPKDYRPYVRFLMSKEVIGKLPSKKLLKERRKGFIYCDGKLFVGLGRKNFSKKRNLTIEDEKTTAVRGDVRGATAGRGFVSGLAKIVFECDQQEKVKEGDILVTPMTTPNFLPAMKRAAAFVTDEGGITCHAAIIARELKKPCVIGTKIATKVLHDGDLVEVDADKGIILILK